MKLKDLLQNPTVIRAAFCLSALVFVAVFSWSRGMQSIKTRSYESPTTEQKLETCQRTVDELANAVTILAVTHKAGLVGTTCMVDMDTDELELGQRFKACKLAWMKQVEGGE